MDAIPLWRRAAEHISRGVVLRRRLPRDFGSAEIQVTPEAGLKYWRYNLLKTDPLLFQMARELVQEGDVVWDIGSNVGLFALASAALAGPSGQVIAVEPDTWLCSLISSSARSQSPSRASVSVLAAAISDQNGLAHLQIAARSRSANHLEGVTSDVAGGVRTRELTATFTLDGLLDHLPHPNVLKIDVEGMEHRVLQGATRLLRSVRPRIWCEVWSRNQHEATQLLHEAQYKIFPANVPKASRQQVSSACWDTLALPGKFL